MRGRRAVEFQKTLTILAPVRDVFAFWQHYENFPYFMTHVREVRNGGNGISHWRVEGPAFVWHFRGAPHVHVWVNVAHRGPGDPVIRTA